jgi:putative spermidine/putrescine transport system substrate-binding protein
MKKCPLTPAEFFNVKAYPGPRAIVDDPNEALPMALEAVGVAPSSLFPLDIPKAMAELKKIKPAISVWPSSGSQQQQVLIDKQVGAEIMWNGRAYVVQQQNIPNLKISWSGALLPEPNGFGVLKGAPNAAAAFEYFYWLAQHPKNQAEWAAALTYPMPAKNLDSYLPKAVAAALPVGQKVTITNQYWFASHLTTLESTWQGFLG